MMDLAPISLFTYNRLEETKKTIKALSENYLADKSELYIFSDGPRSLEDNEKVQSVRNLLRSVSGFKQVTIIESTQNKGLANSIILGVTEIVNKYGKVIVLEDDLFTTPNFLDFMNNALNFYREDSSIISISGHSLKFKLPCEYSGDVYVFGRSASWGWATWKEEWDLIDWEIADWESFKRNRKLRRSFNKNGSDMYGMLAKYKKGKNNSWAIRFCYNQFKQQKYSVYPITSKVDNHGFGEEATHCNGYNKFEIMLDGGDKRNFKFLRNPCPNKEIIRQVVGYLSISSRIKSRIMSLIYRL